MEMGRRKKQEMGRTRVLAELPSRISGLWDDAEKKEKKKKKKRPLLWVSQQLFEKQAF